MYYDEQVINGVLCHRGTPNGKWTPFTVEQLTARLQELKAVEQQRALDLREVQRERAIFLAGGDCAVMFDREERASQ